MDERPPVPVDDIEKLEKVRPKPFVRLVRGPSRSTKQRPRFTRRERAKKRRRVKRKLGLTRRQIGRIWQEADAGIDPPAAYLEALAAEGL